MKSSIISPIIALFACAIPGLPGLAAEPSAHAVRDSDTSIPDATKRVLGPAQIPHTGTPSVAPAQFPIEPNPAAPQPSIAPPALPAIWADPGRSVYARTDYLFWWLKGAPLSVPLITTGPIASTHHGLVGPPAINGGDTTILYGAGHKPAQGGKDVQEFAPFSGMRLTLGWTLDDDSRFAIEGSGFLFERRTAGYKIRSDSSGFPIINIPVYNSVPYTVPDESNFLVQEGEDGLPASLPDDPNRARSAQGIIIGGVKITNTLRFWGADAVGVIRLYRTTGWQLSGLVGFRYLDLAETFHLGFDSTGLTEDYAGMSGTVNETFRTRNQFYGGILGLRGRYQLGRLTADFTGRIAMGASHEVLSIWGGFESFNFTGSHVTGPEGVFAQPSNEGRTFANNFAVVPEAQVHFSYAVTRWASVMAGYEFLYYSHVIRPGDQLNRNLPKGQTFQQAGVASSTTDPIRLFNARDFFAHGLNVGLLVRY